MHINCPHCHQDIEVVEESSLNNIDCPSCGGRFSLVGDDTNKTLTHAHTNRTISRFQLLNEVGAGAFGSVWRGKDLQLDRTVAIKIPRKGKLNQKESEQFFREARATAQLKHPNIVPIHEIGKDGETIYIVSDFVQGISLADRLTAGPMTMRESAELCITVAHALEHAHANGVIHRDLKPSNIMLDDNQQPHVMDFGLAKREAGEITITLEGQILGTPAYMSPEQARGEAHAADGRTDVYSLGVVLFQLLTGELPFRGNTRMLIHQILNESTPSVQTFESQIGKDLATITAKCLEKDPSRRYGSATELADDLKRYLNGQPIIARPVGTIGRFWRWLRRNPSASGMLSGTYSICIAVAGSGWCMIGNLVIISDATLTKKPTMLAELSSLILLVFGPMFAAGLLAVNGRAIGFWIGCVIFLSVSTAMLATILGLNTFLLELETMHLPKNGRFARNQLLSLLAMLGVVGLGLHVATITSRLVKNR